MDQDLTAVHGLTFVVSRGKVLEMLEAKIAFFKSVVAAWQDAAENEKYLNEQTADAVAKAKAEALKQGMPPQMVPEPPQRAALVRISKQNARAFQHGVALWEVQRDHLAPRDTFTLTAEQLAALAVDNADKVFPPGWEGFTN